MQGNYPQHYNMEASFGMPNVSGEEGKNLSGPIKEEHPKETMYNAESLRHVNIQFLCSYSSCLTFSLKNLGNATKTDKIREWKRNKGRTTFSNRTTTSITPTS